MPKFFLSPSRIARFFFHECERHLRFHATPRSRADAEGVPAAAREASPITAAILEGGYRWEEQVVSQHLRGRVRMGAGVGALRDRVLDEDETREALRALRPGEYLYQPTLATPPSFLARYGLDPALVGFAPCRPDLLACVEGDDGVARVRVIDVKASDALKASHRVQVTLYALILREALARWGIALEVDLDEAAIWLFERPEPEPVALALTRGVVEDFLRDRVPAVLASPPEDVAWHLFFRCEWCEYYDHCREEADRTRSVSLLPYLSVGGRVHLREARGALAPVNTLDELSARLEDDLYGRSLDDCGSLRGRRDRLLNAVDAIVSDKVIPHGGSSIRVPVFEHVKLVVTVQTEPLAGRAYAAGFSRAKARDLYGTGSRTEVFVAKSPDDCARVRRDFVLALHDELLVVHQANAKSPWAKQKTLQTYVYDTYEETHLHDLLFEALRDPATETQALELLFHFQNEGVLQADEHPGAEVPFPVVVLTSVLRELVALPAPVAFHLVDVARALPNPDYEFSYERDGLFDFVLSNALKSDAVFLAWNGVDADATSWVERRIKARLWAVGNVVEGLRHAIKDRLFAWPPKFSLPGRLDLRHVELSRVAFVTRYEALVSALESRGSRTRPRGERERDGSRIPLEHLGGDRWRVGIPLDDSLVDLDGFWDRLLTPDTEEGERAQMAYDDYARRKQLFSTKDVQIARVVDKTVDPRSGLVTELTLERGGSAGGPAIVRGARFALARRVTDFISDRIVARVRDIDADDGADFLALLRDPRAFADAIPRSREFVRAAAREEARAGLTPSQSRALAHLFAHRLSLVWGPPGTGKTHFLVEAITRLARAYAATGATLRVAVAAFTHAAIENVLAGLARALDHDPEAPGLDVFKFDATKTPKGESLDTIDRDHVVELNGLQVVLGATVHGLRKVLEAGADAFDVLIIDEASQMKFGELAMATVALAPGGRLVLAGDDLQLPPILKGRYPAPDDGLPGIHDSVFAWLRARQDPARPYTTQLAENWRMNATLSRFSADTLYSPAYRPATAEVAAQRLALAAPPRAPETELERLVECVLSPDHPLVLCVSDGVRAATENRVEAALVAALADALRARMGDAGGAQPFTDDAAFWKRGLFVVSPHHAQIRAIRAELAARRAWSYRPFVDTVDKMQGQEAQAVLVSYGVSDPETALQEAGFIYSLPRLNVSVSRARAKCVVFLPRPLLEPSFDVLTHPEASKGLAHMHALVAFASEGGARETFSLDDVGGEGATVTVLRGGTREG